MQSLDKFPKCYHSIPFRDFCFKKYCILQLYWSIRVCPLPGRCVYGVLLYRRPPVQSPRFTQRPSWGKSLKRSKPNINQTKHYPNQNLPKPKITQTKPNSGVQQCACEMFRHPVACTSNALENLFIGNLTFCSMGISIQIFKYIISLDFKKYLLVK